MTCKLATSYLASLNESRIKPGLERIREALVLLGSPQLQFPHVLVGGTNGKGSVAAFISTALTCAGYRTGLYTSPHLVDFGERIVVDGVPVEPCRLEDLLREVKETGVELTYFEAATATALLYFAWQRVDAAVLEVGLGGAWDATNAVDPILSVITSVDLDHQEWLGHSVEDVAAEKGGIMRPGRPVVLGPLKPAAGEVLLRRAAEVGAEPVVYGKDFTVSPGVEQGSLRYRGTKWDLPRFVPGLKGSFQADNAACALASLEVLSSCAFEIGETDVIAGIEEARWPGRFQVIEGSPSLIVDSAHNRAAVGALVGDLADRGGVVWLFSALAGKDAGGMAAEMSRVGDRFVVVELDHPRGRTRDALLEELPEGCRVRSFPTVGKGLEAALTWAGRDGCVVVAGSVVLAGQVLKLLGERRTEWADGQGTAGSKG